MKTPREGSAAAGRCVEETKKKMGGTGCQVRARSGRADAGEAEQQSKSANQNEMNSIVKKKAGFESGHETPRCGSGTSVHPLLHQYQSNSTEKSAAPGRDGSKAHCTVASSSSSCRSSCRGDSSCSNISLGSRSRR